MSQVTDPALWAKVKRKWHCGEKGGVPGQWNARKAQLAVQEYKRLGGTYKNKRPSRKNSLAKWTKEDWGYIDGQKGNRYLPRKIRSRMSANEKRTETGEKKVQPELGDTLSNTAHQLPRNFNRCDGQQKIAHVNEKQIHGCSKKKSWHPGKFSNFHKA